MKYTMIATKPGIFASYVISGGTSATGAAKIASEKGAVVMPDHVHMFLGFELAEWALLMGIAGTIATMVFQYLNYRNNKKKNK